MAIHNIEETFKVGTVLDWKAEDKKVYDKIIEKHHNTNVDFDDWYEFVFEDFLEDHKSKDDGLEIEYKDISFSGFWSQGDGASFTGKVTWKYISDFIKRNKSSLPKMEKFIRYHKKECEEHRPLIGYIKRIDRHYSHYNTVNLELDYDEDGPTNVHFCDYVKDNLFEYKGEFKDLDNMLSEELKNMMKDLYKKLEETYDDLTSNEQVEESLMANEFLFDANGKIHNE